MALLARREHAGAELCRKLVQRGFQERDVLPVLEALENDGWLSNARFALAHAQARVARGIGPLRIREELRERGVSSELIREALEAQEADWEALADAARRKRFGEAPPESAAQRAKQLRFLAGRGFEAAQCRRTMNGSIDRDDD